MEQTTQQQQTDHEAIARLAYQIWEQRGCPGGYDVEFWLEAERQILSSGKPSREKPAVPAGSRIGRQATTKAEREGSQRTPPITVPAAVQTKPAARAAAGR